MTATERIAAAYPAFATLIAGKSPMAEAFAAWERGECITKITARDLAEDAKCED
jgi:hypothetical protein